MAVESENAAGQEPDWLQTDARILGQILSAQNMLFTLPDETRITEFFSQALREIPGVTACSVRLSGKESPPSRPGMFSIPIFQLDHIFGFLVFEIKDMKIFSNYVPFLTNLANFLALSLENRMQRSLLEAVKNDLEKRVEERTRDLSDANAGLLTEIQERRNAEAQLTKLSRLYATLSNVNQSIVRIHGFDELLAEICRIAVEDGGLRLAWIGMVDDRTGHIEVRASCGTMPDYLSTVGIDLADPVQGNGPTGMAIKTGNPVVVNDIAVDTRMAPWKENALESGYRSSASFPLSLKGAVIGALNVYSCQPDSFGDGEIALFTEMAKDISFALEFMESEKKRNAAETALLELNNDLEKKVIERTKEIEEKNIELDRMNRLFVGRELRMVELKARIRELEKRRHE